MPITSHFVRGRLACLAASLLIFVLADGSREVVAQVDNPISLSLRSRAPAAKGDDYEVRFQQQEWQGTKSAVIVCDMWDSHHCKNAVDRVTEMAPRMNNVLKTARALGALIIHAPSSCVKSYEGHPGRERAKAAPTAANLPEDIGAWCHRIPAEERGVYPIDQSDGGCDTEGDAQAKFRRSLADSGRNPDAPWQRQIDILEIHDEDAITDSGVEVWNLLEARGIQNVIVVGVHTNMCVLGRPFGLRQLSKNGKNVVLMRDMTDTMYNPAMAPKVNHYRGTDLIIEHIEKFVCPTVTSDQLLGDAPFGFSADPRPHVVVAIAESVYQTSESLPPVVTELWENAAGHRVTVLQGDPSQHRVPGLAQALRDADALVLSVRRQALPAADLAAVRAHLEAGKPLLALRTSSHAFDARGKGPKGHAEWKDFDPTVLGGNYDGHHSKGPVTTVRMVAADRHPVLDGVHGMFLTAASLYKTGPLAADAVELLRGEIDGHAHQPIAWVREHGAKKAKIFYTSLGERRDFDNPHVRRLLANALRWALDSRAVATTSGRQP